MSERILVLASSVPPELSGTATIVGNLAQQFSRDEMVIVGERARGRPDMLWRANWPELVYPITRLEAARRGARWWRRLQFPVVLLKSILVARRLRCTSILAIYPNQDFLFAAYLTARWTGAKLFPYFHNMYVDKRSPPGTTAGRTRFAQWLQARVLARAAHVFVMSEGMLEFFEEHYPGLSCSALPHSFNEPMPEFAPPPEPGSPLRFIMSGTVNKTSVDAACRLAEAVGKVDDASLTLWSGTPSVYFEQVGILREGVRLGSVPRNELLDRLRDGDIMLLPHGLTASLPDEEMQSIFPTKTIEYLICGRPILAHVPRDSFLARFLKQYECALVVDEPSVPALMDAIERLRTDAQLRSDLVRNALRAAEMFHAPRVGALLRSRIENRRAAAQPLPSPAREFVRDSVD